MAVLNVTVLDFLRRFMVRSVLSFSLPSSLSLSLFLSFILPFVLPLYFSLSRVASAISSYIQRGLENLCPWPFHYSSYTRPEILRVRSVCLSFFQPRPCLRVSLRSFYILQPTLSPFGPLSSSIAERLCNIVMWSTIRRLLEEMRHEDGDAPGVGKD